MTKRVTLSTTQRNILFNYLMFEDSQDSFDIEKLEQAFMHYDLETYMGIINFIIDAKVEHDIRVELAYYGDSKSEYWWNRKHNAYLTNAEVTELFKLHLLPRKEQIKQWWKQKLHINQK